MPDLIETFTARGDLAHLALFLWATSASAFAAFAMREVAAASRRFDDFVRELARLARTFRAPAGKGQARTHRPDMDALRRAALAPGPRTRNRRDHLDVFREFLDHLDRAKPSVLLPAKGRRNA